MVRKQIYLGREQDEQIKSRAAITGLSESEVIRQAIDRGLSAPQVVPPKSGVWERELRYMRELEAKGPVPGGRMWKREDLYDR
jgi:hypothetical protein